MNDQSAPKKSVLPKLLVALGCLVLVLGGGCIALIVGVGFWGLGQFEEELCEIIRSNPVVLEHIGTVETCDLRLTETRQDESFPIRLEGSRGSGTAFIRFDEDAGEDGELELGVLRMDDGTEYDLTRTPESSLELPAEE